MAKILGGVKPDIFEITHNFDALSESDTVSVMWLGSEVSTDDIPVLLSESDVDVRGAHAGSLEFELRSCS